MIYNSKYFIIINLFWISLYFVQKGNALHGILAAAANLHEINQIRGRHYGARVFAQTPSISRQFLLVQ